MQNEIPVTKESAMENRSQVIEPTSTAPYALRILTPDWTPQNGMAVNFYYRMGGTFRASVIGGNGYREEFDTGIKHFDRDAFVEYAEVIFYG